MSILTKLFNKFRGKGAQARLDEALLEASTSGHSDAARALLQRGANPNFLPSGDLKAPPLLCAVRAGSLDAVKALVDFKADLNATGYECRTAMHEAIWRGHEDIALFLSEAGTNPNTVCRLGTTPLQDAVKQDQRKVALAVCAHGADATGDDAEGFPLRKALELRGWQDVVDEIDRPAREAAEAARRQEQFAADLDNASILQSVLTIKKPLVLKGP